MPSLDTVQETTVPAPTAPVPGSAAAPAAGLDARRTDDGRLVATGEGPWTTTTAVVPVDADGRPTGPAQTTSAVRLAGAPVATVHAVHDWDGTGPLPQPTVTADGPVLRIAAPGATVDVRPGLVARDGPAGTEVALPPAVRDLLAGGGTGDVAALLETPPRGADAPSTPTTPETESVPAPSDQIQPAPPEAAPAPAGQRQPGLPEAAVPTALSEEEPALPPATEAPAVELLMPPAPTRPGPAQTARIADVSGAARTAAGRAADLPPAAATVADAHAAVGTPQTEADARAGADLAAALAQRPAPSPEILALCDRIRTAIRERRPANEKELTRTDIEGTARQAGQSLDTAVQKDTTRVQGAYEPLRQAPAGAATKGTPAPQPPPGVTDPGIAAGRAAPDPIPAADLALDADRDRVEAMAGQSRIERHSTEPLAQTPPFSDVRAARDELAGVAATGPADVAAQQAQAIAGAQADMAALQRQALAALGAGRAGTVTAVAGGQTAMVGQETATRESVSRQAQAIVTDAQTRVRGLLDPLSRTAMARWDAEVARLSREFREHLDSVQRWIDERHAGASGWAVAVWDAVTGLPNEVAQQYDDAEKRFGDGVCDVLTSISTDVNAVIAAAEAIIADARARTGDLFGRLPAELREWAAGEQGRFEAQLDGLAAQARDARTSFVAEIADRAVSAVAEVQAQVEELRAKAGGLVGRIRAAIDEFVKDPTRAIINGLLTLVGIPPESFWALVERIGQVVDQIAEDPETFGNNLVEALRLGFRGFFDRFGQHLVAGFWQWLFSRCKKVGVTLPTDSSLGSIVRFILSIMGITWPNIRKILVRHVGAKNVEIIEKVWEIVSLLIEKGPDGILEMLKEKLDPETIVNAVVEAAVQFTVEALVEKVALRLLAMLNPAGAVLQAIQVIYKVLKWVFENAARIFTLVETVVTMCAEIMAGKLGHVAELVEKALAFLLPMVIDLLAELIGLGDLPDKVAEMIGRLQAVVLPIVERVIVELVTRGKALLAALGLGGKDDKKPGGDDELGTTVRFSAGGESHRVFVAASGHVMVASIPATAESKFAQWREQAEKLPDKDDRAEAKRLLDLLQPLIATADQEGAALAAATKTAEPGTEQESDDKLEDDEREIAGLLDQLYTLLVPDIGKIIDRFSPFLPEYADDKVAALTGLWASWLEAIQVGPVGTRRSLVASGTAALAGLTGALGASVYTGQPNLRALAGYFILTTGDRDPAKPAFYEFVFTTRGPAPPHEVRPKFLKAVGDAAVTRLREYVPTQLPAMALSPDEATKIAKMVADARFVASSDAGRFDGLTTRPPDHTFFMPKKVDQKGRSVQYTTMSGQTFEIELDDDDLPKRVAGRHLTLFVGRGVTQNSPYYVPDQGFNRAHVIANRFGGSGYSAAHNVVTTSEEYNQGPMRDAEDRLVTYVNDEADTKERAVPGPGPTEPVVTFSLEVGLTYADPTARLVAARIAKDENLVDKAPEIEAEILKKITEAGISAKLKRVEDTRYDLKELRIANQGIAGTTENAGPDLWLLSRFGA